MDIAVSMLLSRHSHINLLLSASPPYMYSYQDVLVTELRSADSRSHHRAQTLMEDERGGRTPPTQDFQDSGRDMDKPCERDIEACQPGGVFSRLLLPSTGVETSVTCVLCGVVTSVERRDWFCGCLYGSARHYSKQCGSGTFVEINLKRSEPQVLIG